MVRQAQVSCPSDAIFSINVNAFISVERTFSSVSVGVIVKCRDVLSAPQKWILITDRNHAIKVLHLCQASEHAIEILRLRQASKDENDKDSVKDFTSHDLFLHIVVTKPI